MISHEGDSGVRLESPDVIGTTVQEAFSADRSTMIDLPLQVLPPRQ